MYTDSPLIDSQDDKLGRSLFATEIASGLVNSFGNTTESVVLGINGSWGSGKSTLINFIISEVEKKSKETNKEVMVLKFNPWMFSGQSELQNIFLKELYRKFENEKDKLKTVSKKISDFLDYLNWLKYVHSGAKEVIDETKSFLDKLSKDKDLAQLKSDVDAILIESKIKLYITIDDIDRLTPSEITDIFQLVKLNGNFANTIFILAYDQEVVINALEAQFKGNGRKYIEKIVQIDYTLPNASEENLSRIFVDSLNKLFHDEKILIDINKSIKNIKSENFIKLFKSIRDVYRFNNSIKLRLPSIYKELNVKDFFLVEALRIFSPEVYYFILNSKDKLVEKRMQSELIYQNMPNDSQTTVQFIDSTNFDSTSKSILKSLFVIKSFRYVDQIEDENLIREKKIANTNYFDRYFSLQLNDFDIPEVVFENFLINSTNENKIKILSDINLQNKLFQFLYWLEIKSYYSSIEEIESIISTCFNFSDNLDYKPELFDLIDSQFMTIQRFCSKMLSRFPKIEDRRKCIFKHISPEVKLLSFSSIFTANNILRAKGLLDKNELHSNRMWYDLFSHNKEDDDAFENHVVKIYKKNLMNLFEKEINNPNTLNGEELIFILPELKRLQSNYYDSVFPEYISDDIILINILLLCITRKYAKLGAITGFQLPENSFLSGMDKEEIKKRLETMDQTDLSKDQLSTINFFLQAYKDGFIEGKFYDFYTLANVDVGV